MTYVISRGTICLFALALVSAASADQGDDSPHRLSVAPSDHFEFPSDRPTWIKSTPDLESRIHVWPVVTTPCDTFDECEAQMAILQKAAVMSYIRTFCKSENVDFYDVNEDWIKSELIVERYEGDVSQGDDQLVEQAVLLEFTPRVQRDIQRNWKNVQVEQRIGGLGILVSLGFLGLVCSSVALGTICRRADRKNNVLA